MTEPDPDDVPDFIARISDALRFVFAQDRDDIVVLVGDTEPNRELLPQLQAAPSVLIAGAEATDAAVRGHTRIRRISDTLLVVL
jgi:hypothetical protein